MGDQICSKKRSGIELEAANWLQGTGAPDLDWASCNVAWIAYSTVRESFMI